MSFEQLNIGEISKVEVRRCNSRQTEHWHQAFSKAHTSLRVISPRTENKINKKNIISFIRKMKIIRHFNFFCYKFLFQINILILHSFWSINYV